MIGLSNKCPKLIMTLVLGLSCGLYAPEEFVGQELSAQQELKRAKTTESIEKKRVLDSLAVENTEYVALRNSVKDIDKTIQDIRMRRVKQVTGGDAAIQFEFKVDANDIPDLVKFLADTQTELEKLYGVKKGKGSELDRSLAGEVIMNKDICSEDFLPEVSLYFKVNPRTFGKDTLKRLNFRELTTEAKECLLCDMMDSRSPLSNPATTPSTRNIGSRKRSAMIRHLDGLEKTWNEYRNDLLSKMKPLEEKALQNDEQYQHAKQNLDRLNNEGNTAGTVTLVGASVLGLLTFFALVKQIFHKPVRRIPLGGRIIA